MTIQKPAQNNFSSDLSKSLSKSKSKKLFILDTNVLMHDPTSIFKFEEHDIFLPMSVIEELDNNKSGLTETARNVRHITRYLDDLIKNRSQQELAQGLTIEELRKKNNSNNNYNKSSFKHGKLFLQTHELANTLPTCLPGNKVDNAILKTAHSLQTEYPNKVVALVSKDINLRIKAALLGIHAEDYYNDRVLDNLDSLYRGIYQLDDKFWENNNIDISSWSDRGNTYYKITSDLVTSWSPNQFLFNNEENKFQAIVREIDPKNKTATVEYLKDYTTPHNNIWGVMAKNDEQNFALNLLLDPDIDFITIHGSAGTGKTLLTLAAALVQTLDNKIYNEIIMTRATVPVGNDIGFLPGTEEEKMTPWMGALMDNLEFLSQAEHSSDWERNATKDLISNKIKIRSLNFMRGRTFLNKFIIIDEAQNLSAKQMQTLITRAGPNTKIVCLGNLSQIDTPYLTETSCGLTYVIDNFKNWAHSGHITLTKGERSRLADFAAETL